MLNYSSAVCNAELTGATPQTSKTDICLSHRATQVQRAFSGYWVLAMSMITELRQSGMQCKTRRCSSTDKQG